jgi:DNA recombination-dependent growth factor C
MGILSASVSITRFKVDGKLPEPILETVAKGLKEHTIREIDEHLSEKSVGWTSFATPYQPNFESANFNIGTHLVFALRMDRKTIPAKLVKKHIEYETAKRLAKSEQDFISKSEKKMIKEHVHAKLCQRIPATPNTYDIIWNYEDSVLWFFTNLKSANQELESLFFKSFKLTLIRLLPYTVSHLLAGLSTAEQDALTHLSPTIFAE